MEVEYIAASEASKKAVWLKEFLELKVVEGIKKSITLSCENQAANAITKDPMFHSKCKHIEGRYCSIHGILKKKEICMEYLPSHDMTADPLTKGIHQEVFNKHIDSM